MYIISKNCHRSVFVLQCNFDDGSISITRAENSFDSISFLYSRQSSNKFFFVKLVKNSFQSVTTHITFINFYCLCYSNWSWLVRNVFCWRNIPIKNNYQIFPSRICRYIFEKSFWSFHLYYSSRTKVMLLHQSPLCSHYL